MEKKTHAEVLRTLAPTIADSISPAQPKEWTVEDVRQNLPDLNVLYGGRVYRGHVSGRRSRFATVWTRVGTPSETAGTIVEATYSWEAVARALNGQRSLSLGGM